MQTISAHLKRHPKILLLGYSGACNTGAEALLLADIADLRALLGEDATLVIPTINPANLRRYVPEAPNQQIVHMPTLFFGKLRRLVRECDLVMLVEGSTYMDTWSSVMLWAYLWTTECAHQMGKPCLAYAVDAGALKPMNRRLVGRVASKTQRIITRAAAAAERLRAAGVTCPMETTADNALTFATNPADEGLLAREWPAPAFAAGISPVCWRRNCQSRWRCPRKRGPRQSTCVHGRTPAAYGIAWRRPSRAPQPSSWREAKASGPDLRQQTRGRETQSPCPCC